MKKCVNIRKFNQFRRDERQLQKYIKLKKKNVNMGDEKTL